MVGACGGGVLAVWGQQRGVGGGASSTRPCSDSCDARPRPSHARPQEWRAALSALSGHWWRPPLRVGQPAGCGAGRRPTSAGVAKKQRTEAAPRPPCSSSYPPQRGRKKKEQRGGTRPMRMWGWQGPHSAALAPQRRGQQLSSYCISPVTNPNPRPLRTAAAVLSMRCALGYVARYTCKWRHMQARCETGRIGCG